MTASAYHGTLRAQESSAFGSDRLDLVTRLYVWSVVMEPLLLFVMFDATKTGFTGNLSKLLQLTVAFALVARLTARWVSGGLGEIRFVRFANPLFRNFRNYFGLLVLAGIIGAMSGAYDVPFEYSVTYVNVSGFSAVLNSPYVRPIVEYGILLYYFWYFVILPKYVLNSRSRIEYFFKIFKLLFLATLVLGFVDLIFAFAGVNLIPRHFADETFSPSGGRFHGIAGEPRDAFVYLFLGLAILHLRAYYTGEKLGKFWIVVIVTAIVATQSASGLVGLLIFCGLYFLYSLRRLSPRKVVLLPVVLFGVVGVIYISIISSERILDYIEAASGIWEILESGREIPHLMAVQMVNIYPFYDLTVKFRNSEFLPILIGSGLGSASAINNFIPGILVNTLVNPHSQITRVLYESGIVGTYLFVRVFTAPVNYLTRNAGSAKSYEFMLLMLLVLSCSLGHRSSAAFIYLGIVIAATRLMTGDGKTRTKYVFGQPVDRSVQSS